MAKESPKSSKERKMKAPGHQSKYALKGKGYDYSHLFEGPESNRANSPGKFTKELAR